VISESAFSAFRATEDQLQAEMDDVRAEADELMPGWGQHIWQQALQLHAQGQEAQKRRVAEEEAARERAAEAEREAKTLANR
jgi:ElaB/YqjD/DUF883 family membrane-anchored ribosome-binding protein